MAIMTGNALTMTIPQLENAIGVLKGKLEDPRVKDNETLTTKVNNLLYDYTKAKNKILRFYEKSKKKHPELVRSKLTVAEILKKQGHTKRAGLAENKRLKWNYNAVDLMRDTKGLALGIAGTCIGLGAMNAITLKSGETLLKVVSKAVFEFLKANPVIAIGLAVGGTALAVPAISRGIQKIKQNKTMSREMHNEILKETSSQPDWDPKSIESIKEVLKEDPEMMNTFKNDTYLKAKGFSPLEISNIKRAISEIEQEQSKQIKDNNQKIIENESEKDKEKNKLIIAYADRQKRLADMEKKKDLVLHYEADDRFIKEYTSLKGVDISTKSAEETNKKDAEKEIEGLVGGKKLKKATASGLVDYHCGMTTSAIDPTKVAAFDKYKQEINDKYNALINVIKADCSLENLKALLDFVGEVKIQCDQKGSDYIRIATGFANNLKTQLGTKIQVPNATSPTPPTVSLLDASKAKSLVDNAIKKKEAEEMLEKIERKKERDNALDDIGKSFDEFKAEHSKDKKEYDKVKDEVKNYKGEFSEDIEALKQALKEAGVPENEIKEAIKQYNEQRKTDKELGISRAYITELFGASKDAKIQEIIDNAKSKNKGIDFGI